MTKRFLFCLFALTLTLPLAAQFKAGIRAGLSTFDVSDEQLTFANGEGIKDLGLSLENANYNFHAGLWMRFGNTLYLQPEFLLNTSKVTYELSDFGNLNTYGGLFSEQYLHLDIPVLVGLKLGPVRLNAGPVGHIFLDGTSELNNLEGFEKDFRDMTLGWQGGLGLDIGRLTFDFRYEGNLQRFGDQLQVFGESVEFTDRPSRLIGSVGYRF